MDLKPQSWWRTLSIEEFCDRAGLDPRYIEQIRLQEKDNDSPASSIINAAIKDVFRVVHRDKSFPTHLHNVLKDDDALVSIWVDLSRTHGQRWQGSDVIHAIRRLEPAIQRQAAQDQISSSLVQPAAAFAQSEQPDHTGSYPSKTVYSQLLEQHAAYGVDFYSPYTTIVGPSGIGKSFMVKQLAVRHGLFVCYTNLSPPSSRVYPRPTVMAQSGRDSLRSEDDWACYIGNQIRLAACCKAVGITAAGLFTLATADLNQPLAQMRAELTGLFRHGENVSTEVMEPAVRKAKGVLEACNLNSSPIDIQLDDDENNNVDLRPTIVCLDEARALLDEYTNESFRNMRKAAAHLSRDAAFQRPDGKPIFFLVLLDTTSKVSNFAPPTEHDPSAKWAQQKLFDPIHQIDTLDVFAKQALPEPSGNDDAVRRLFSCGRPLWGAFLTYAGYTPNNVCDFATAKVSQFGTPNEAVYGIALLSYRVRFYVASPSLADDLVASMMRFLLAISPERNWLLTTQPSEPVLAFVAARLLQKPATRLTCIRAWVAALNSGTVNPGDVGEQVASLLLLFSFDYAAEPAVNPPRDISLRDFLTALLGEDVWNKLGSASAGVYHEILDRGKVFMNHVVRTKRTPTLGDLDTAYRRGCALLLPPNFPGMDIAIPVRLHSSDDASDANSLAMLLVQVKNRKADSHTRALEMSMRENLGTATAALNLPEGSLRGTMGLAMCLRTNASPGCAVVLNPRLGARHSRRPRRAHSTASASESAADGPGLLALAFGLDPDVYPCLGSSSTSSERRQSRESNPLRRHARDTGPKARNAAQVGIDADATKQVCALLQKLLATWPEAYAEELSRSVYAKKMMDPFYTEHVAENGSDSDESSFMGE